MAPLAHAAAVAGLPRSLGDPRLETRDGFGFGFVTHQKLTRMGGPADEGGRPHRDPGSAQGFTASLGAMVSAASSTVPPFVMTRSLWTSI